MIHKKDGLNRARLLKSKTLKSELIHFLHKLANSLRYISSTDSA